MEGKISAVVAGKGIIVSLERLMMLSDSVVYFQAFYGLIIDFSASFLAEDQIQRCRKELCHIPVSVRIVQQP